MGTIFGAYLQVQRVALEVILGIAKDAFFTGT
jgi:hypothetical protein